jgi:hypothetical protein
VDTTLLLLGLFASTLGNVVLAVTLGLTVRSRGPAPAAPEAPEAPPAAAPPAAPVPREASRREVIVELLKSGLSREDVIRRSGAAPGEVDLVVRLARLEGARARA